MPNEFLKNAAAKAGITEEQAKVFVKAILHPSNFMCEIGRENRSIGTFQDPPEDLISCTLGEFQDAEAARVWRAMCSALLRDDVPENWGNDIYPHPVKDFDRF